MIKRFGKFNKIKKLTCMGLAALMLTSGCGQETVEKQEIELIDPVSTANINERVARRTIYDYEVIEGNVFPIVTEYPAGVGMKTADIGYTSQNVTG